MSELPATSPVDDLIHQVANNYGLAYDLLRAQVFLESSFDPNAFRYEIGYFQRYVKDKSVAGSKYGPLAACSYGLLQILLETALEQGFDGRPEQLFQPQVGLAWGAKYLRHCLTITDQNYPKALARYNGSGTAAQLYAERVYALAGRTA